MLTHDLFTPMNSTLDISPDCFIEIDNIAIYEVSVDEEVEGKGGGGKLNSRRYG